MCANRLLSPDGEGLFLFPRCDPLVHGREAVREYWTRQWAVIDPHVDPVHVADPLDGSTLVSVHQVVKDLEGRVLLDETIAHRFQFEGDLVTRFDIEGASELSTISHHS